MAVELERGREGESASTEVGYWRARFEDERRKLAMLWKAFEDAEARLAVLEGKAKTSFTEVRPEVVEVVRTVEGEESLQPVPKYPVSMYKVNKIPGVTAADAEKLRNFGINLTDQMLHADLEKLAEATNLEREKLQRWRDIAELMAINGIGAKWAEELVDAGVTNIRQLSGMTATELYETLIKRHEARGTPEKERLLMERTLPARSKKLINAAKRAANAL